MKEILFCIFEVLQFLFLGFAISTPIFWIFTMLSRLPKDKIKHYLTSANMVAAYGGLLLAAIMLLNVITLMWDPKHTDTIYTLWPYIILICLVIGTSMLALSKKLSSKWFICLLLILVLNGYTMMGPLLSLLVFLSKGTHASSWSYYGEFGNTFWLGVLGRAAAYFIITLTVMELKKTRATT